MKYGRELSITEPIVSPLSRGTFSHLILKIWFSFCFLFFFPSPLFLFPRYGSEMPASLVAQRNADLAQLYTQHAATRPLAVSMMVVC